MRMGMPAQRVLMIALDSAKRAKSANRRELGDRRGLAVLVDDIQNRHTDSLTDRPVAAAKDILENLLPFERERQCHVRSFSN